MPNQSQTTTIINHIRTEYAVEPEFLWPERFPTYSVFRHTDNKKWFALVASIPSTSLGLKNGKNNDSGDNNNNEIDIINLKSTKTRLMISPKPAIIFSLPIT